MQKPVNLSLILYNRHKSGRSDKLIVPIKRDNSKIPRLILPLFSNGIKGTLEIYQTKLVALTDGSDFKPEMIPKEYDIPLLQKSDSELLAQYGKIALGGSLV